MHVPQIHSKMHSVAFTSCNASQKLKKYTTSITKQGTFFKLKVSMGLCYSCHTLPVILFSIGFVIGILLQSCGTTAMDFCFGLPTIQQIKCLSMSVSVQRKRQCQGMARYTKYGYCIDTQDCQHIYIHKSAIKQIHIIPLKKVLIWKKLCVRN